MVGAERQRWAVDRGPKYPRCPGGDRSRSGSFKSRAPACDNFGAGKAAVIDGKFWTLVKVTSATSANLATKCYKTGLTLREMAIGSPKRRCPMTVSYTHLTLP